MAVVWDLMLMSPPIEPVYCCVKNIVTANILTSVGSGLPWHGNTQVYTGTSEQRHQSCCLLPVTHLDAWGWYKITQFSGRAKKERKHWCRWTFKTILDYQDWHPVPLACICILIPLKIWKERCQGRWYHLAMNPILYSRTCQWDEGGVTLAIPEVSLSSD